MIKRLTVGLSFPAELSARFLRVYEAQRSWYAGPSRITKHSLALYLIGWALDRLEDALLRAPVTGAQGKMGSERKDD